MVPLRTRTFLSTRAPSQPYLGVLPHLWQSSLLASPSPSQQYGPKVPGSQWHGPCAPSTFGFTFCDSDTSWSLCLLFGIMGRPDGWELLFHDRAGDPPPCLNPPTIASGAIDPSNLLKTATTIKNRLRNLLATYPALQCDPSPPCAPGGLEFSAILVNINGETCCTVTITIYCMDTRS